MRIASSEVSPGLGRWVASLVNRLGYPVRHCYSDVGAEDAENGLFDKVVTATAGCPPDSSCDTCGFERTRCCAKGDMTREEKERRIAELVAETEELRAMLGSRETSESKQRGFKAAVVLHAKTKDGVEKLVSAVAHRCQDYLDSGEAPEQAWFECGDPEPGEEGYE